MSTKLSPGAKAPALSLPLVGGGTFDVATAAPEAFTMLVVYRGYHCPICKDYLGKLEAMVSQFTDLGVQVVTASMDGEERAAKAKEEWGLANTPVAYGMTEATARAWGLWISKSIKEVEADIFAEPGLFWIMPDGTLYLIDIANMPFARPDLELLLSRVKAPANGYPTRGTLEAA